VKATEYGWGSAHTLGLGAVALALMGSFVVLESPIENPIMPLRVFAIPGLAASSAVRGFLSAGMWATFFLGALYLERVRGYGALDTGLAFMPLTVAVGVLSTGLTARMLARFGAMRVMIPGLISVAVALLLLTTAGPHDSYFPKVAIAFFLFGLGAGSSFIPLLSIAMARVPKEDAGIASGVVNVSMQISAAIGLAVLATISTDRAQTLTRQGKALPDALTGGYHLAFLAAAGSVAIGVCLALILLRKHAPGPAAG
jgi:hypothetical protein